MLVQRQLKNELKKFIQDFNSLKKTEEVMFGNRRLTFSAEKIVNKTMYIEDGLSFIAGMTHVIKKVEDILDSKKLYDDVVHIIDSIRRLSRKRIERNRIMYTAFIIDNVEYVIQHPYDVAFEHGMMHISKRIIDNVLHKYKTEIKEQKKQSKLKRRTKNES